MITAAEARKKQEESREKHFKATINQIEGLIEEALKRAESKCRYPSTLSDDVKKFLREEPNCYKIQEKSSQRDGIITIISW